jgi:hypothetical protein
MPLYKFSHNLLNVLVQIAQNTYRQLGDVIASFRYKLRASFSGAGITWNSTAWPGEIAPVAEPHTRPCDQELLLYRETFFMGAILATLQCDTAMT